METRYFQHSIRLCVKYLSLLRIFSLCFSCDYCFGCTPGSGKSYAIVNNYIKQQIEKGFSMYIYDFKFDDLSTIAYNHLLKHLDKYEVKPQFYVINFDDPRKSLKFFALVIILIGKYLFGSIRFIQFQNCKTHQ